MATFTVTTLFDEPFDGDETIGNPDNGGLSLREAIGLAAASAGRDTIVFDPRLVGRTFELTGGTILLNDTDGVTISGTVTIDAKSRFGVFGVTGGTATLDKLTITGGSASNGAGVSVASGANLTLTNATVRDNTATATAGGILVAGTLTAVNATFAGNSALGGGGVVVNAGGNATLANTTVFGNSATQGLAGGIANSGTLELTSSTVTSNSATVVTGGLLSQVGGTTTVTNSIVAGNFSPSGSTPDVSGAITSTGVNIFGQDSVSGAGDADIESALATDIFASTTNSSGATGGAIADNGGFVQTVAIKAGGTADNAGDASALPPDSADIDGDTDPAEALPIDARGFAREAGGTLDVGAVELSRKITVTTLDDELDNALGNNAVSIENFGGLDDISLREAFALLGNYADDPNTIIDFGVTGTIELFASPTGLGGLTLANSATIKGTGVTLDGNAETNILSITGSRDVAIEGMTLTNGASTTGTAGISAAANLTLTNVTITGSNVLAPAVPENDGGAGVFVLGNLTMVNTDVTSNYIRATNTSGPQPELQGGGIRVVGNADITGGSISGNTLRIDWGDGRGGGIFVSGTLSMANTVVSGNSIDASDGESLVPVSVRGGGIATGGTVSLTDVTLTSNVAQRSGNDARFITGYAEGGGLFTGSAATVVGGRIAGNRTEAIAQGGEGESKGGGASVGGGSSFVGTTIDSNRAIFSLSNDGGRTAGGGIFGYGLTVIGSTISNNSVGYARTESGGGIFGSGTFINSTFVGNASSAGNGTGRGGGIFTYSASALINSTVVDNSSSGRAGGIAIYNGPFEIKNSIITGNQSRIDSDLRAFAPGIFVDGGGNVISTQAATLLTGNNNVISDTLTDIFTTGTLADNGGPVLTIALKSDGVAVNAGLTANLPPDSRDIDGDQDTSEALPIDARGEQRVSGPRPDAGAMEVQVVGTLVVDTLTDEAFSGGTLAEEAADGDGLSLREAIDYANANLTDANSLITFLEGLNGTLTLTQGTELLITNGIKIQGNGIANTVIDGQDAHRVFNIETSDAVSLSQLTVANGYASGVSPDGGGIRAAATTIDLTLDNVVVTSSSATRDGGGVVVGATTTGTLTIVDSTISSNTAARSGGGLFSFQVDVNATGSGFDMNDADLSGGGLQVAANLMLTDSTVSNNTVIAATPPSAEGAGLLVVGNATISGSSIIGNRLEHIGAIDAQAVGGGVTLRTGNSVIENSTIADNTVIGPTGSGGFGLGGGVFNAAETLTIKTSTVDGNSVTAPETYGGGVFSLAGSLLNIISSTVSGNSASGIGGGIFQTTSELNLVNATIHGNTSPGAAGIYQRLGSASVDNSTVSANTGGQAAYFRGSATISNSVFLGNSVNDAQGPRVTSGGNNVFGTISGFSSAQSDVIGATAAQTFAATGVYDTTTGGQLADHGGPVRTVMISPTGPAKDIAQTTDLPLDTFDLDNDSDTSESLPLDARGFTRSVDFETGNSPLAPDAGAAELQPLALVVTTLDDEAYDQNANNATDGKGLSLREAIEIANRNPGQDAITFAQELLGGTLHLTQGTTLLIQDSVTIDGDLDNDSQPDITISGDVGQNDTLTTDPNGNQITQVSASLLFDNVRVFNVLGGSSIFNGLTITGGEDENGAGGIFVLGGTSLSVTNSSVSGNQASVEGDGGGIFARGQLSISDSIVAANVGYAGGGIYAIGIDADPNISGVLFTGNYSVTTGGAVQVNGRVNNPAPNDVGSFIENSTFVGNRSQENGGGIYNQAGLLTIRSSTISGNSSRIGDGGGVSFLNTASTFTEIASTIVFNNSGNDIAKGAFGDLPVPNLSGSNNLVGRADALLTDGQNGNIVGPNIDPLLGPLTDNGGPTPTVALLPGSPAINNGSNPGNLQFDQRGTGFDRSIGDAPDIGAFEAQTPVTSLIVTTLDDEAYDQNANNATDGNGLSLREAIEIANRNPGADTITFHSELSGGVLRLTSGLTISDDVTINGDPNKTGAPDITISGDTSGNDTTTTDALGNTITDVVVSGSGLSDNVRVFDITSGATSLDGLIITGGGTDLRGGGIRSLGDGTLSISNSSISGNNTRSYGGGVYVRGNLIIEDSVLSGNYSGNSGGAIYLWQTVDDASRISGALINDNNAQRSGGGLFLNGLVRLPSLNNNGILIENSTIYNNYTREVGGGIFNFDGLTTIRSSTIAGNSIASVGGSGIAAQGDTFTFTILESTIVAGNRNVSFPNNVEDLALYLGDINGFNDPNIPLVSSNNLVGDANGLLSNGVNSNIIGDANNLVDPLLDTLKDNGGPTPTLALLPGGPAINAGANPGNLQFDQRGTGFDRTVGSQTDIGAFEFAEGANFVVTTADDTVDNTDGVTSLREAILAANGATLGAGTPTITFDNSLDGAVLFLTNGELDITRSVIINGDTDGDGKANVTISGDADKDANAVNNDLQDGESRIFDISGNGTDVVLTALTLTDGRGNDGGAVAADRGTSLTITNTTIQDSFGRNGGGINSDTALTVANSLLTGNSSTQGGGILVGGTLDLINVTLDGNEASQGDAGGAIATQSRATISVENSTITDNKNGAINIFSSSTVTIENSVFASNTGTTLLNDGGTFTAKNSFFDTAVDLGDNNDKGGNILSGNDPMLGALADNGGPTRTRLPGEESPLIGAGDKSLLPADALDLDNDTDTGEPLPLDGRGSPRVNGSELDIGAVEVVKLPPVFEGALADGTQTVSVVENSAFGTAVFDVDANNGSGGATDAGVTYRISAGNLSQDGDGALPFAINTQTGAITVNDAGDLDFDITPRFSLTVEADNGSFKKTATVIVDLNNANDAPEFAGLDNAPAYVEDGPAVILDADATIADDDLDALNTSNGNYSGASLTFRREGGAVSTDVFDFNTEGSATLGRSGNDITSGGNVIATVIQIAGVTTLRFTDQNGTTPTNALVNEILQATTYSSTAATLQPGDTGSARIELSFDDGAGQPNSIVKSTLKVAIEPAGTVLGTVVLTSGQDSYTYRGDADQTAAGLAGADFIATDAGNDILLGGADGDVLNAGTGQDTLVGGAGTDGLSGGVGDDSFVFLGSDQGTFAIDAIEDFSVGDTVNLFGFAAQSMGDITFLNNANGIIAQISNTQWIQFKGITDQASIAGQIVFEATPPILPAIADNAPTRLSGGNDNFTYRGNDDIVVVGLGGADFIATDSGADRLIANEGGDVLRGRAGNDTLVGGSGTDELTGGLGNDVFSFSASDDSGLSIDAITDFEAGDIILLEGFAAQSFGDITILQNPGGVIAQISAVQWVRFDGITDASTIENQFVFV
ncbi:MAG: choice-of-anchor Q domain-containing protein [Pseudomonadota bacterium]